MEDNKNQKNIIIVLILVIILLIGGLAVLITKLSEKQSTNNSEKINDSTSSEETSVYVTEAYHKHINLKFPENLQPEEWEKKLDINRHVILPKITIKTSNAETFNKKILNDYKDLIDSTNKLKDGEESGSSIHVTYDYYINDKVIFITIKTSLNNYRGSGSTTYKGYYYSITEDKEFSNQDILNKYGITINDINNRINELNKSQTESDKIIENINNINDIDAIVMIDNSNSVTFYNGLQNFYFYKSTN